MAAKKKKEIEAPKVEEKVEEKAAEPNWDAIQKKEESERKVRKALKFVVGLLFCVGGGWLITLFWQSFVTIFKQWVGVGVILIGLFVILLAMLD